MMQCAVPAGTVLFLTQSIGRAMALVQFWSTRVMNDAILFCLVEFGVKEVEYPDQSRFYFQAPGGQVFRLASEDGGI